MFISFEESNEWIIIQELDSIALKLSVDFIYYSILREWLNNEDRQYINLMIKGEKENIHLRVMYHIKREISRQHMVDGINTIAMIKIRLRTFREIHKTRSRG